MRILDINKSLSVISLIVLYYLLHDYFTIDYNFIILLIELLLVYIELKNVENDNFKINFLLGILAGTTILFKQTTGIIISSIVVFYKILNSNNKNNYKKVIKESLIRIFGVFIPILIGILYLLLTDTLLDFDNYAIKGIKTFSNNFIGYTELFKNNNFIIRLIAFLTPISTILMYIFTVIKEQKNKFHKLLFILFAYGFAEATVIFPIATVGYLMMGMIINFIAIIYMISYLYTEVIADKININIRIFIKYFFEGVGLLIAFIILIYSFINLGNFLINTGKYKDLKHFKYIKADLNYLNEIRQFIFQKESEGKKVYILDATAAIYMIPLDKYNKDYDMFLVGNLGADGEEGQIENIKKMSDNEILLIKNENYSRNWQNPEKVRGYIIDNWTKIGEIESFDIYEKSKTNNVKE